MSKTSEDQRIEPEVGQWQHASAQRMDHARNKHSKASKPSQSWPKKVLFLLLLLVMFGAAIWLIKPHLKAWTDVTSVRQNLLTQAQQAEQAKQWHGEQGAISLYRAMLALDPDDHEARQALTALAEQFIAVAQQQAKKGDEQSMNQTLALAQLAGVGMGRVEDVRSSVTRDVAHSELMGWIDQARQAEAEGEWLKARDAWLAIRNMQPENTLANAGLKRVLDREANQVTEWLEDGNLQQAKQSLGWMAQINADYWQLGSLRAKLSAVEAVTTTAQTFYQHSVALRDERMGHEQAQKHWRAINDLALPSKLTQQKAALATTWRTRSVREARTYMNDFAFKKANQWLDLARLVSPRHSEVRGLAKQLRQKQQERSEYADADKDDLLNSSTIKQPAVNERTLMQWLRQAEKAMRQGDWAEPPGQSAYDLYRKAQQAAPSNPQIRAAFDGFKQYMRRQVQQWMQQGDLRRAARGVDQWEAIVPKDQSLKSVRHALAKAMAGRADELLGANQIRAAQIMINRARMYDPHLRVLPQLQARLDALRAAQGAIDSR